MNRTQINKIRMYSATDMVLENHAGVVSGFPELRKPIMSFRSLWVLLIKTGRYRKPISPD
jgi:hypothetical protein